MTLQFTVLILCLAFIVYVVYLVAKEKLLLKYSLIWIALAAIVFLCALYPQPLYAISSLLGFVYPSNFIFLIGLFFLMAISLSLSTIVSRQSSQIKTLIQEQALLEKHIHGAEYAETKTDNGTEERSG